MGSALYYSRINSIDVDVDYRSQAYLGPCFSNSFFFPRNKSARDLMRFILDFRRSRTLLGPIEGPHLVQIVDVSKARLLLQQQCHDYGVT